MIKLENKKNEKFINFLSSYETEYGSVDYELELSIPYSLISHLIGFECTIDVAKRFLFVDELVLGEIEGKHSYVESDIYCNRNISTPCFSVTHDFMYENFMEDFLDCIEIDDSNYDTDVELSEFLCELYNLEKNESLTETIKEILKGYAELYKTNN